jgi:hypothetical protein
MVYKIGFDIDGVVADMSAGLWVTAKKLCPEALELYMGEMKQLLNPRLFTYEDDEIVFVTSRKDEFRDLTLKWCKRFYPDIEVVFANDVKDWDGVESWDEWFRNVAISKVKTLRDIGVKIYFEDQPLTVKHMREIAPEITTIQYGGRLR